ncbi:hypothetical protein NDU88_001712 [Pleurodeles waltl]|uniref:Uncharacterized protein n=1 Tax=Pleurodeles waltl TaxID=8319 RepID=A0AAV7NBI9_PLEWA|nr:hypothetical protein NDU88_001712 [Pleurodeles waltl]
MGKRKAADLPVPSSGTKKSKKRLNSKMSGHPNNSSNPLEEIDTLFEEVEAILRSTSIPPPIRHDTISCKKIPDIFRKRPQMPNLTTEAELHIAPPVQIPTPPSMTSIPPCAEPVECPPIGEKASLPSLGVEVLVSPDIPCSNLYDVVTEFRESSKCDLHLLHEERKGGNPIPYSSLSQDGQARLSGGLDLAPISQMLDDLKNLVLLFLNKSLGEQAQRVVCNCQRSSGGELMPVLDGASIAPSVTE